MIQPNENEVAVLIGRFQVDDLHAGHITLLKKANNHKSILVFICTHPFTGTKKHPMDYPTREIMIRQAFAKLDRHDIQIAPLVDRTLDSVWTKYIMYTFNSMFPHRKGVLYIGRNTSASILDKYEGNICRIETIWEEGSFNATKERATTASSIPTTKDGRAGIIYDTYNRYPQCQPTVDIAILNFGVTGFSILLGRKDGEDLWRLPGGMVDPGETYEDAAIREAKEETSIYLSKNALRYEGSFVIDDWRNQEDKQITTILYSAIRTKDAAIAKSDLIAVKWFDLEEKLTEPYSFILPAHKEMINILINQNMEKRYDTHT